MAAKNKKKLNNKHRSERIYVPYEKEDKGPSWVPIIILFVTGWLTPIAVLMLVRKLYCIWRKKKQVDYRNYAAIIGDRCEIDIHELSAKLGKTPALVISDLQMMIDKGYMGPDAYLDRSRGVLVLEIVEADFVEEEPEVRKPIYEQSAHEEPKPESAKPAEPQPVWQSNDFEEKLKEIRKLNDEIDDDGVSARIDRIGSLTASIFTVVRQKPERADEVKKFMNYYLPTTFKLLKSYALMEKQSYQGENIVASRKKIENILDSLIVAFEQQQDRLFRTEALDVEADIQVLETMMAKDGLVTPKGIDLRAVSGGK